MYLPQRDTNQRLVLVQPGINENTGNVNYPITTPDNAVNDYLEYTPNGVNLIIDVHDFTPNEISCKVSKLLLEVIAESNRVGRCGLFRKYVMPQNLAPQHCICRINGEGVMIVAVPWEGNNLNALLN